MGTHPASLIAGHPRVQLYQHPGLLGVHSGTSSQGELNSANKALTKEQTGHPWPRGQAPGTALLLLPLLHPGMGVRGFPTSCPRW